jgi:hypothetical protein
MVCVCVCVTPQGAESVLRRMLYHGVQPNIITYNSLVTAYSKDGDWQVRATEAGPNIT